MDMEYKINHFDTSSLLTELEICGITTQRQTKMLQKY